MEQKTTRTFIQPVYFKFLQAPKKDKNEIIVLIHGWAGNEDSMSIFSSIFPKYNTIVFPRGILEINSDQYGWVDFREKKPTFDDYSRVSEKLFRSITELTKNFNLTQGPYKINLIGFSQGAAICATLSIIFPNFFRKVALLAGFLPDSPPKIVENSLSSIQYYIAHGTDDQIVDFNKSLELRNYLQLYGADVKFCQEVIGHRVGKNCLRNLKGFFE